MIKRALILNGRSNGRLLLEIPREMLDMPEQFLAFHPMDPIPLNLASAASMIFFDL